MTATRRWEEATTLQLHLPAVGYITERYWPSTECGPDVMYEMEMTNLSISTLTQYGNILPCLKLSLIAKQN